MNNKEERNKKIVAICLVVLVLFVVAYNVFFNKEKEEKIDTTTISIVKDNSRFYTVSSCVNKFLSYLTSKSTDNILLLLDENYKTENNITKENIYNFVGNYNNELVFSPKKMYEQRLSKSVYKYYIKGNLQIESIDNLAQNQEYYIIVIMDQKNLTFSIMPYDGEMFR